MKALKCGEIERQEEDGRRHTVTTANLLPAARGARGFASAPSVVRILDMVNQTIPMIRLKQ